jgi:small nuclear ribonucleoprotein D3
MATIGVPIKVLHEAEGHVITVETTSGEVSHALILSITPTRNLP